MVKLQLTGMDGNAFSVMGRASAAFKQAGVPKEEIEKIMQEARAGDFDHLLLTITDACDKHKIDVE